MCLLKVIWLFVGSSFYGGLIEEMFLGLCFPVKKHRAGGFSHALISLIRFSPNASTFCGIRKQGESEGKSKT